MFSGKKQNVCNKTKINGIIIVIPITMKKIYFLLVLFCFSVTLFAQDNSAIPSIGIPKVENKPEKANNPSSPYSISNPFTPKLFKTPSKTYGALKIENQNQFNAPVSDINPGKINAEKLNKSYGAEGNGDSKIYRRNQFLGDFKTKSELVGIFYRDFGEVDGDLIRVLVNDKEVISRIYLQGNFMELDLKLEKGFNKIDFEALNQGTSGPNTAEFKVYDDASVLISQNQWNLATGFKATIIIVKE
jgi:hypothetical protein